MSERQNANDRYWEPIAPPSRVGLGVVDYLVRLWRAKWLMLAVFGMLFGAGLLAAFQMTQSYTASSRLLVTLDDAYVFRPLAGGDAAGVALEANQVVQAELELLRSPVILATALDHQPYDLLYPDLAKARDRALNQGRQSRSAIDRSYREKAIEALDRDFEVGSAPERPVIFTRFRHEDPLRAADTLNLLIETYLTYRTSLFSQGAGEDFAEQSDVFQAELTAADRSLRTFMLQYDLTDLTAEQASVQRLIESVEAELLRARAQQGALQKQLISLRTELDRTPREVELFVEDTSQQTLLELELEREALLSRYTPNSEPLRAINARISQVEAIVGRQAGVAGMVRRGINPVYQSLITNHTTLDAEAEALAGEAATLELQMAQLERRADLLVSLAPGWRDLLRDRSLAEANVFEYSSRAIEERSRRDLVQRRADNIRVLEPAHTPAVGNSLKLAVVIGSFLFAGFSALMAGLLYTFTRTGFTTPASLARTTGLPVLAALGR
ncbi:MAG: Wzz/FepE/Etk N-terminal domain-containing protein [Pseudomonadota bacterium]